MSERPLPGEKYKHFKGGKYEIVCISRDSENPNRELVIYKSLYEKENFPLGTIWSRSLEDFVGFKEIDGKKIKRFEKIL